MPTPTPSRRSQLQEDTYFRVLRTLRLLEVSPADGLAQAYQDFLKNRGSQRPAASR